MNDSSRKKFSFGRWVPLFIVLCVIAVIIYFKLYQYVTFAKIQQHYKAIETWRDVNYFSSVFIFVVIYVVSVSLSLPGASLLTMLSGFLFGPIWGTLYVVVGATIGATSLFLVVNMSLGEWVARKAKGWVLKMEHGFQENAFNYLLFLRLVPVFPFWVVNIVSALLNVTLKTFFFATMIGIIPGAFVYVLVGDGLGAVLEQNKVPDLGIIFQANILLPLLALALLSLAPMVFKKMRAHKNHD